MLIVGKPSYPAHPAAQPRASEDLFDRFSLADIAASVARTLPNGEKNAIRKTYKGHIKRLGVTGHFDAVKKEVNDEGGFMHMLRMPDQEWNVHFVRGKEVDDGLSATVAQNLVRAMTMVRGTVPKQVWDSSVLGELAPSNITAQKPSSAKPTAPSTPAAAAVVGTPTSIPRPAKPQGPTTQSQAQVQAAQEAARPKRNIKKRSYGDSSYEGYGEGYIDDDLDGGVDMDGYETGEGMDGSVKRRKKVRLACGLSCFDRTCLTNWHYRCTQIHSPLLPVRFANKVTARGWWEHDMALPTSLQERFATMVYDGSTTRRWADPRCFGQVALHL